MRGCRERQACGRCLEVGMELASTGLAHVLITGPYEFQKGIDQVYTE